MTPRRSASLVNATPSPNVAAIASATLVDAEPEQLQALHEKALKTSPNYYHLTSAIPARAQLVIRG